MFYTHPIKYILLRDYANFRFPREKNYDIISRRFAVKSLNSVSKFSEDYLG